tara:strand:+ start:1336 stop:3690 length:2355 start_codon:yes stop_codon:yes gene_type:complete
MKLSTKAQNLDILKKLRLKKSKIPKFFKCTVEEWISNKNEIAKNLREKLNKKIIIRSSYILEDSEKYSMAGEFEGFSKVKNIKKDIFASVASLIRQYKKKSNARHHFLKSEIIFQNMILNTQLSGVLTNFCIKDGSFYYVINYDDISGSTDSVTSGSKTGGRVINIFRDDVSGVRSKKLKKVIESTQEIERRIGTRPIDLEFAIDKNGILNIFQIRPLTTSKNWKKISSAELKKNLKINQKLFFKINRTNNRYGTLPVFGLMPDWNPAEMIGYQPNNLSYSIYKEIITDNAWSFARQEMGYKKVLKPLMYKFTGKPYIDTRLSFYSLIPRDIPNKVSKKIVNYWSKILISKPYLHDKIEFEIADGSYDAFSKNKIKNNYKFLNKFEREKYYQSLKKLTEFQIKNFELEFKKNNEKLIELEKSRIILVDSFLNKKENFKYLMNSFLTKIKTNGIIPFAKYARNAFIAKKILNSLKNKNYINLSKMSGILNSLNTITSQYLSLSKTKNENRESKLIFENLFYHLRPGTYDITVKRAISDIKVRKINNLESILSYKNFSKTLLSTKEIETIDNLLKKDNFKINALKLYNYIVLSLKLRENSKFIFTRALSDYLQIIEEEARKRAISLEKISNLDVKDVLKNFYDSNKKVNYNVFKNKRYLNSICKLPYLITNRSDFFVASILISKPNFITDNKVVSKIFHLKKGQNTNQIKDKIVLIENADPGFDWIFSYKIKGLITKYGGVNSHMSIRCHELNIPAAIGVGEESFDKLISGDKMILNCKEKKIFLD